MDISAKINDGLELHKKGDLEEAKKVYLEILEEFPKNPDVNNLLGLLCFQKNDLEKAEKYLNIAFLENKNPYFLENYSKVLINRKKITQAIEILEEGIKSFGEVCELMFNLALAYKENREFSKSRMLYEKVIKLNPKLHQAYFNLAYLCFNDNEINRAVECYEKALETAPNDFETMYFLSLAYMQSKDYEKGLKFFESRLCRLSSITSQQKTYPNLTSENRIWKGEDISDKTIYTYYEAGFGDVIMFARYLPILQKRCKKIIFKPQEELIELFRYNFPDIDYIKLFRQENEIAFDFHLPILSLPYVMGLKGEEIFAGHEGYLKADEVKVQDFKKKFFDNKKFKIGIKWQGNTFYDLERVISVESFFPLMDIENTQFYSCQTLEGSEEYDKIKSRYDIINLAPEFKDFSYTAAAIENMDLVICNDTSLAHVAGALGKPCWVVLPRVYNWRWHDCPEISEWYDSIRLFRQEHAGNWEEVFERIKIELLPKLNK